VMHSVAGERTGGDCCLVQIDPEMDLFEQKVQDFEVLECGECGGRYHDRGCQQTEDGLHRGWRREGRTVG
jgi:predicted metal-binding protein